MFAKGNELSTMPMTKIKLDESAIIEQNGKKQNDLLNWLQDKLEEEMKKPSYKDYYKNEYKTKKRKSRKRHTI